MRTRPTQASGYQALSLCNTVYLRVPVPVVVLTLGTSAPCQSHGDSRAHPARTWLSFFSCRVSEKNFWLPGAAAALALQELLQPQDTQQTWRPRWPGTLRSIAMCGIAQHCLAFRHIQAVRGFRLKCLGLVAQGAVICKYAQAAQNPSPPVPAARAVGGTDCGLLLSYFLLPLVTKFEL